MTRMITSHFLQWSIFVAGLSRCCYHLTCKSFIFCILFHIQHFWTIFFTLYVTTKALILEQMRPFSNVVSMLEDTYPLTLSSLAFSNILAHIFQFFQMLSPCLRILTPRHSPPFLNRSSSFRRKIWLHREEWPGKDLSTIVGKTWDDKKSNQPKKN